MGRKGKKREREGSHGVVDSEGPAKRKRQVTDDKLQLYRLYEDLAAESDNVRLEAAKQLIMKFSPENRPSAEDIHKALNRLIQGLCTQRKAARVGFCVPLTELLRQHFGKVSNPIEDLDRDVESLLKRIERQTKVEGNCSGMERRDYLIGKLFAYKAVLQSSILLEPELSMVGWNEVLDRISELARDVPWLREECGLILVQVVESLNSQYQSVSSVCAQAIVQRLLSFNLVNTPEGVAIWLALQVHHNETLPVGVWHQNDPLSKKERTRLAKALRQDFQNSADQSKSEAVKSAPANPNPPFAWGLIMTQLLRKDGETTRNRPDAEKAEFSRFWLDTVDAHLFGLSSSHERKSWGFKLFTKFVCEVPDWAIPVLFSPNLMRTLLNQTKKDDRFLHVAALNAWKAITHRAQHSPCSTVGLIVGLTSGNGTADFDNFTKVKTLETIVHFADDDSLRRIVRHLHSLIIRPETTEQSVADHRRQTIADLLLNIVRNYKRYEDLPQDILEKDTWLRNTLELLVEYAYFVPSQNAKTRRVPLPLVSKTSMTMFQERLSSCLTRLLNVESRVGISFGLWAIRMIRSKTVSSKTVTPAFEADSGVLETVNEAFQALEILASEGSAPGTTSATQGFIYLYTFTLLQVYNGDGDAVMMLHDIDTSRKSAQRATNTSAQKQSDGFVEILLSFLGNPRSLFHKIAIEAFSSFASELSMEGVNAMLDVLRTEESLEGQRQLFAQDDEISGEEEMEEGSEDASDVEMIDEGASDASEGEPDSSGEELSSDDESGSEDEEDEELTQFNNMLAMTLQTSKPVVNGDASEESSDESDMDDEQMMALDPHLSKIFKQRSQVSGKKEREKAKKNIVQFKSRVLDLLAIFLDKQYSNPLTLEILVPMLRLTHSSANKQLADKSFKILKSTFEAHAKHKTPLPEPDNVEATWDILQTVHNEAKLGGGANVHANACSAASLHIVKILIGLERENYPRIVNLYAESQKQWFMDRQSAVQPALFTQFLNWSTQSRSGNTQK